MKYLNIKICTANSGQNPEWEDLNNVDIRNGEEAGSIIVGTNIELYGATSRDNMKDGANSGHIDVARTITVYKKGTLEEDKTPENEHSKYYSKSRQFSSYSYNSVAEATLTTKDGKKLRGCTLIYSEPEYWNYYRESTAMPDAMPYGPKKAHFLLTDYEKNPSEYKPEGTDYLRKDVYLRYPFKHGELAVIENEGNKLVAPNIEASSAFKSSWYLMANDAGYGESSNREAETSNRLYEREWRLNKLEKLTFACKDGVDFQVGKSGTSNSKFKVNGVIESSDSVSSPGFKFSVNPDQNKMYSTNWTLHSLNTIDAPNLNLSCKEAALTSNLTVSGKITGNKISCSNDLETITLIVKGQATIDTLSANSATVTNNMTTGDLTAKNAIISPWFKFEDPDNNRMHNSAWVLKALKSVNMPNASIAASKITVSTDPEGENDVVHKKYLDKKIDAIYNNEASAAIDSFLELQTLLRIDDTGASGLLNQVESNTEQIKLRNNIENGEGLGSLQQISYKDDPLKYTQALGLLSFAGGIGSKANHNWNFAFGSGATTYMGGSVAFNAARAGMTEEEFLTKYPNGADTAGYTWGAIEKGANSFAFAINEGIARGWGSFAGGRSETGINAGLSLAFGDGSVAEGRASVALNRSRAVGANSFACGLNHTDSGIYGAFGERSAVFNCNNAVYAENASAFGYLNKIYEGAANASIFGNNNTIYDGAENAVVFGNTNTINKNAHDSVLFGTGNIMGESAANSVAFGNNNQVLTTNAMAFGYKNIIESLAKNAMAFGSENEIKAKADNSAAFGAKNILHIDADNSIVAGSENKIEVKNSAAFGLGLINQSTNSFVCGKYNEAAADRLFAVGFGSKDQRKDMFYVSTGRVASAVNPAATNGISVLRIADIMNAPSYNNKRGKGISQYALIDAIFNSVEINKEPAKANDVVRKQDLDKAIGLILSNDDLDVNSIAEIVKLLNESENAAGLMYRITDIETKNSEQAALLSSHSETLATHDETLVSHTKSITNYGTTISSHTTQISSLNTKTTENSDAIQTINNKLVNLLILIDGLSEDHINALNNFAKSLKEVE